LFVQTTWTAVMANGDHGRDEGALDGTRTSLLLVPYGLALDKREQRARSQTKIRGRTRGVLLVQGSS
jgi:hypothetical protein